MTSLDAAQTRRKALWNAKCRCHGPLAYCRCIDACEGCGHVRGDHANDEHGRYENCDVPDCGCSQFTEED